MHDKCSELAWYVASQAGSGGHMMRGGETRTLGGRGQERRMKTRMNDEANDGN